MWELFLKKRVFMFANPDFEQKDQPIDVSEVYIDTKPVIDFSSNVSWPIL